MTLDERLRESITDLAAEIIEADDAGDSRRADELSIMLDACIDARDCLRAYEAA